MQGGRAERGGVLARVARRQHRASAATAGVHLHRCRIATEGVISRYALENLDHQLVAGVEYRIGSRLFHSVMFRYTSRVSMDDYYLVDTKLTATARCRAEGNLLDITYRETNLVTMPGRWVQLPV